MEELEKLWSLLRRDLAPTGEENKYLMEEQERTTALLALIDLSNCFFCEDVLGHMLQRLKTARCFSCNIFKFARPIIEIKSVTARVILEFELLLSSVLDGFLHRSSHPPEQFPELLPTVGDCFWVFEEDYKEFTERDTETNIKSCNLRFVQEVSEVKQQKKIHLFVYKRKGKA